MTTNLEEIGRSRYVSLTTYRKDGTGVATPVWHAVEEGELFVWTNTDSWKVRRIRADPRVTVSVCDVRGRVKPGTETVEGTARLLDAPGTEKVRGLISRKYGWQFWLVDVPARIVRRGGRPHTGIAVSF
ncbi:PPOX class F420-dependent oxidoreductase [Streptomyces hebeiensis]|uniref:PPOX class F420-dependent oxidoreductase n=1 Tax=Streptomyces hebeiensis TaxID=229486 RepID=A0ABN1UZ61_9ACTN